MNFLASPTTTHHCSNLCITLNTTFFLWKDFVCRRRTCRAGHRAVYFMVSACCVCIQSLRYMLIDKVLGIAALVAHSSWIKVWNSVWILAFAMQMRRLSQLSCRCRTGVVVIVFFWPDVYRTPKCTLLLLHGPPVLDATGHGIISPELSFLLQLEKY
jgi:hypothetical protein